MSDTAKPFTLTFEERTGYLLAHVSAETISGEQAIEYINAVVAKCRETRNARVVLVRDIPIMLRTGALFFTTDAFAKLTRGIRIAFVNPHADLHEDFEFAITIARNRQADFSIHRTVEEAERSLFREKK